MVLGGRPQLLKTLVLEFDVIMKIALLVFTFSALAVISEWETAAQPKQSWLGHWFHQQSFQCTLCERRAGA